jgi:hypothetical protein
MQEFILFEPSLVLSKTPDLRDVALASRALIAAQKEGSRVVSARKSRPLRANATEALLGGGGPGDGGEVLGHTPLKSYPRTRTDERKPRWPILRPVVEGDLRSKVAHGFEVVQSIFPRWQFSVPDTVAAFGVHGALVIGPPHPLLRSFTFSRPLTQPADVARTNQGGKTSAEMFNASRTMHKAARSASSGSWGQEVSIRQEETCRFEAHTRFDEAVSG